MTALMHLLDRRYAHAVDGDCWCDPDVRFEEDAVVLWHFPLPDPLDTNLMLFLRSP